MRTGTALDSPLSFLADPFDPVRPEFVQNPYALYAVLREQAPVFYNADRHWWLISKYEDVHFCLRDRNFTKVLNNSEQSCPFGGFIQRLKSLSNEMFMGVKQPAIDLKGFISNYDPPQHTKIRTPLNQRFSKQSVQMLTDEIAQYARQLWDDVENQTGAFDLLEHYAFPLSSHFAFKQIGIPQESKEICDLLRELMLCFDPVLAERDKLEETTARLAALLKPIVLERKRQPANDSITDLLKHKAEGRSLSHDTVLANALYLVMAAFESTAFLIGNGVLALLRNPDQFELLRANPTYIERAVDELARFEASGQIVPYFIKENVELRSKLLKKGETVHLLIGSANRDPAIFDEPDRLDILRPNSNRHLAFGAGTHFCLGSHLARLLAQVAISTLVQRAPGIKLAHDKISYRMPIRIRCLESLPVVL